MCHLNPVRLVFCNSAMESILGRCRDELLAMNDRELRKLFHEQDRPALLRRFGGHMQGASITSSSSYRLRKKDGAVAWVEASGRFVTFRGEPAVMAAFVDVTARKQGELDRRTLEKQLRKAQKMEAMADLAAGLAQDFETVVSPIVERAEEILFDCKEHGQCRLHAEEIHGFAIQGRNLAGRLRRFSRREEVKEETLDFGKLVEEILVRIREGLPQGIAIHTRLPSKRRFIRADASRMREVITDLCAHACQAMSGEGGVLSIQMEHADAPGEHAASDILGVQGQVRLTIQDTGPGLEPHLVDRIFDPYFSPQGDAQQAGMGLAMIHAAVKRHGGDIQVRSEMDKGTSFTLIFPAIDAPVSATFGQGVHTLPSGDEHLLLVDDEKPILDMTRQMLERLGYRVTFCSSSADAWAVFQKNPGAFQAVVLDYLMPGMNGDVLAQRILAARPSLPVILCTGFSEKITEAEAWAMGVSVYLVKPVLLTERAKAIRQVLDNAAA